MSIFNISSYSTIKATSLYGRYISSDIITELLKNLSLDKNLSITEIGSSVKNKPIRMIRLGNGSIKILFWSQMHGNESTTTKAVFDIINLLRLNASNTNISDLLSKCSLYFIPMLNPDGADAYTRVNANNIDLNRDAQDLSQPESKTLRKVYNEIKPNYCFNLHGQRTIFGAGKSGESAVASFLSPSQDSELSISSNRLEAMRVIAHINKSLNVDLPNQIGVYDDAFNLNCVGDTFQSFGTPTILFEAGHIADDYHRELSRLYMFKALCYALDYIVDDNMAQLYDLNDYLKIPQNEKCFYDIILTNISIENTTYDLAIQYEEILRDSEIIFKPKLVKINNLDNVFAHKKIDFTRRKIDFPHKNDLILESEIDFVIANNEKISLIR